jgi:hypothetical protein
VSTPRLASLALAGLALGARVAAPTAAPPPQGAASRVQLGVTVLPETVTVGDSFIVRVRVRAPRGAEIAFPSGPDSTAAVEALDAPVVRASPDSSATDRTATYHLAAWDVGALPGRFPDVVVRVDGAEQRLPLTDVRVFVRSVLPADSAKRVPKPPRSVFEFPRVPWLWWLIAALVAALLGLLLWWWLRRRRRRGGAPAVDPYAYAEREFARVEALGLLEAGERGRFVALVVEVLRDYLARRVPEAALSLTTTEALDVVRQVREVPSNRLGQVLSEADLVKFARRPVTAERARELAREARSIVRDVERGVKKREAAAARAAAAGGVAAREEAA